MRIALVVLPSFPPVSPDAQQTSAERAGCNAPVAPFNIVRNIYSGGPALTGADSQH